MRVVTGDWNGAVSRNNRKRLARVGTWSGTSKNPSKRLWRGIPTVGPTSSSVRLHIYVPSHIIECNIKHQINLNPNLNLRLWSRRGGKRVGTLVIGKMVGSMHCLGVRLMREGGCIVHTLPYRIHVFEYPLPCHKKRPPLVACTCTYCFGNFRMLVLVQRSCKYSYIIFIGFDLVWTKIWKILPDFMLRCETCSPISVIFVSNCTLLSLIFILYIQYTWLFSGLIPE